jgi:hypothetical protein
MRVTKSLPRASDASDAIPYSSHDAANRPNNDGSCVTMTNDAALDAALPAMQLARSGRGCGVRISSQLTAPKASGSEEAKPNHRGCKSGESGWDCVRGSKGCVSEPESGHACVRETMWWIRD